MLGAFHGHVKGSRLSKKRMPRDFLGHGMYGAVFNTPDPKVVLKLTRDKSEVVTAKYIEENPKDSEGFAKLFGHVRINRHLWAIWREPAFDLRWEDYYDIHLDTLLHTRGHAQGLGHIRHTVRHVPWEIEDLHEDNIAIVKRNNREHVVIIDYGL